MFSLLLVVVLLIMFGLAAVLCFLAVYLPSCCAVFSGGFLSGEATHVRLEHQVLQPAHRVRLPGLPQAAHGQGGARFHGPLLPTGHQRVLQSTCPRTQHPGDAGMFMACVCGLVDILDRMAPHCISLSPISNL